MGYPLESLPGLQWECPPRSEPPIHLAFSETHKIIPLKEQILIHLGCEK